MCSCASLLRATRASANPRTRCFIQIRATVGLSVDVEEPMTPADQSAEVECQACMCDVPAAEVRALRCGHTFCNDCWREYLTMRVVRLARVCWCRRTMGGKPRLQYHRWSHGAAAMLGAACSRAMGSGACSRGAWTSARRPCLTLGLRSCCRATWLRSIANSFSSPLSNTTSAYLCVCARGAAYRDLTWAARVPALHRRYCRWCSRPGCEHAVEYPPGGMRDIECRCGNLFCFACGMEPHRPAACELVKQCVLRGCCSAWSGRSPNFFAGCGGWERVGGWIRTQLSPRT